MNLNELTFNAEMIFRGTVMTVESGTVMAGGGELDTTRYVIRVTDTLKGDTSSPDGKAGDVVEIVMLGSLKQEPEVNGAVRFNTFQPPNLQVGQEYLLFTTEPSSLGLSITVGLGQGAFQFIGGGVENEAKNVGLFRDMDTTGMPARGPIPYDALSQRIRDIAGT